jgi:hypothetical protein
MYSSGFPSRDVAVFEKREGLCVSEDMAVPFGELAVVSIPLFANGRFRIEFADLADRFHRKSVDEKIHLKAASQEPQPKTG